MSRKTLLVALLVISYFVAQAQPWLKSLYQNKAPQEITLQDHKQAFDAYWEPYNVKNGYYYENGVKKKAYGWKQFNRWYYDMQYQVDAQTGAFPKKTAQQVYEEFKQAHPNMRSSNYPANWVSLGTNSSGGGYAGIGRISAIAFHPTDNNTYWIGAPAGGVWRTTDNGNSWSCLTDNNQIQGVADIIIPSDYATSQTIYIATGDRDTWDNRSIGVLKSTDGGATWNTTGLTFTLGQERKITRLLIDPNDNQTILAATSNGVYKTTNGGTNWSVISNRSFIDMEYKPNDFSTLYGSTEYGSIYRSTNSGASWSSVLNNGERIELAVSPANANLVVAVVADYQGGLTGVYKSTNSGASFSQVLSGSTKNLLGYEFDGSGAGGQGWYDLSLSVSPTDADMIFVGGINTWKSTNGGTSWSLSNHWIGDGAQIVHADKHVLKYRSNGDLFEGNDGGIYISTNNGNSWTDKSNGLVISQIYKLGVSAEESTTTITGLQDNGTKLLYNGTWYDVKGGDGMECLIDYDDSDIQYGSYVYGQITRTTDNWQTRTDIEPENAGQGAWVTPYIISPSNHNTLYAGYADVWKTTNKGDSWTQISTFNSNDKIRSMAIAPSNSSVLYVADSYYMWKTTNGGTSWSTVSLPYVSGSITYITVKNDDPNHLWITLSGYDNQGVYESTNGGTTWTNISTGIPEIPVYTIVQNKQETSEVHLYAGTELGVYYKKGNDNWVEYNEGLPKVKCGELEIYYDETTPDNSRLRLASYGRGLWETPLASPNFLPILTTTAVTSITTSSAVSGGNITADGGSAVTARGIVWGTTMHPTLADNVITDTNTGLGSFTSNITGLSASSTYYVRAYATNENGTSYGNELIFETPCEGITSFPYEEGFEGSVFPPQCWTSFRGTNGLGTVWDWKQNSAGYQGQGAYIQYETVSGGNAEDWLVTAQLSLPSASATLSFYEKQSYDDDYGSTYAIKISTTSQTDIASFTDVLSYGESDFTRIYTQRTIDLSDYAGQTVYIAFVMTNNDGDDWYIDNVKVDGASAPPVADFSTTSTQVCSGYWVNFSDLSSNNPTSWSWDFGDDTELATEQNPTHVYESEGTYTVSLTVSNGAGQDTKTIDNYIVVTQAPDAGTNGALTFCEGTSPSETELFNALGGTPDENGTWSNEGLIYTYTVSGTSPCDDATATVTITEIAEPNAGIDGVLNICEGTTPSETDLFNALGGTPDENGTWSNEGLVYTYTVNAIAPCSGLATASVTVTEIAAPNAGTDGSLTLCEGTTPSEAELFAVLEGNPDEGGSWSNEGLIYTYTVSGTAPCEDATAIVTITEVAAPNAGTDGTLIICEGTTPNETDLFNALEGTPDEGGTWTNEGSVYTYTVNATAPCTGLATANITVIEMTEANAGTNGTLTVCEGIIPSETELFAVLGETPDEGGSWSNEGLVYTYTVVSCDTATATVTLTEVPAPNAGTNATLSVCEGITPSEDELFNALEGTPEAGGTWSNEGLVYTYIVSGTSPCDDATATVTITEIAEPIANFTMDVSFVPTVILTNTSTNADAYTWNLGDGTIVTTNDVEHTYTENGTYTINLEATNDCGTSNYEEELTISNVGMLVLNEENIRLFPNPTSDYVKVDLGNNFNEVKTVSIINNLGKKLVIMDKIERQVITLSTKDLVSGVYFVSVLKGDERVILELVVLKK